MISFNRIRTSLHFGWGRTSTHGCMRLLTFRHPEAWRGLGLAYKFSLFSLVSKSHAIWATFQHRPSGKRFTIGSAHVDSGITNDEFDLQLCEVWKHMPKRQGPTFLLGDFNAHLEWVPSEDGEPFPAARGYKPHALQDVLMEQGLRLVPQFDFALPTFVSRKPDVRSTQIDAVFTTASLSGATRVCKDSRISIGTDHEAIVVTYRDLASGQQRKRRQPGGPRCMVRTCSLPTTLDQQKLENLAQAHTAVRGRPKFQLSVETKRLGDVAKVSKTAAAWKAYQRALQQEHAAWQKQLAEDAVRNWDSFRFHHGGRK